MRAVYTDGKPFKTQEVDIGTRAERGAINDVLVTFGDELSCAGGDVLRRPGTGPHAGTHPHRRAGTTSPSSAPRSSKSVALPVLSHRSRGALTPVPPHEGGRCRLPAYSTDRTSRGGSALRAGCSIFFEPEYW